MFELMSALVGFLVLVIFVLIAVAVIVALVRWLRNRPLTDRATMKALAESIETMRRDRMVREVVQDLAAADATTPTPAAKTKA